MANKMSQLDQAQVLKTSFDDATGSLKVSSIAGTLVNVPYDSMQLSYVPSGNGAGEVAQVVYLSNSVVVATLDLTYDSSNRIISVVRS